MPCHTIVFIDAELPVSFFTSFVAGAVVMSWSAAWNAVKYPTFDNLASAATALGEQVATTVNQSEILSSIKDNLTETAAQLAETAGTAAAEGWRVAERFRLEEHITALEQEIERIKRKWGSASWASMDAGDLESVRVIFERAKLTVLDLEAQIEQAQAELAKLSKDEEEEVLAPPPPSAPPPPARSQGPIARTPSVTVVRTSLEADDAEPMMPRDQTPLADGKGGWKTSADVGSKAPPPPPAPVQVATMVFEAGSAIESPTADGYLEDVSLEPLGASTVDAELDAALDAELDAALEADPLGGGMVSTEHKAVD